MRKNFTMTGERRRFLRFGAYAIFLGLLFLLHLIPRSAHPYLFPLPKNDWKVVADELAKDRERLSALDRRPLAHDIRVVGEEFRRESSLGSHPGNSDFAFDVARLLRVGRSEELLQLRALQCELFVRAVSGFSLGSASPSKELSELGGDFSLVAREAWVKDGRLVLNEDELRIMFRIRWSKLAGVLDDRFLGVSLPELDAYFTAMLRYPPGASGGNWAVLARSRDAMVYQLAAADPEYPLGLASGLNLLSLGQPELARIAFEEELRAGRPAGRSLRLLHHRMATEKSRAESVR